MRLFIAINFPDEVKATVAKIRDNLKSAAGDGRFCFDETLHLTLIFLGEYDERQMETIKTVMGKTEFRPFIIVLDRAGFFKRDDGNTWWIGLKENSSLSALQADLSERLKQSGFTLETRKFTPHITLGRKIKMPVGFIPPKIKPIEFVVTSIELMKSEHINGRLTYTPIYSKSSSISFKKS